MKTLAAAAILVVLAANPARTAHQICPKDTDRAITFMTEAREIHQSWIRGIKAGKITAAEISIGGGLKHHRRWVYIYRFTERTLRKAC
jgi:hypothetical protein